MRSRLFQRAAIPALAACALSASCATIAREADGNGIAAWPLGLLGPAAAGHIEVEVLPFFDNNTTVGGTDTINRLPGSCFSRERLDGPERVYRFIVGEDAALTFSVTPEAAEYDPAIYLTDVGGSGEHCLAGADEHGPGGREAFTFRVRSEVGKAYYLYVDSTHGVVDDAAKAAGTYRLEITGNRN